MSFLSEFNELYVNLTYRCNLDCPFCSTKAGGFFNKNADMSVDTAIACVDVLLQNSATPEPQLFFFGGEPLLKADVIKKAVEYGRANEGQEGKKIRFVIVTNGVLLNRSLLEWFRDHRVDLQVNLDGPREIHDKGRCYPGGKGTFDVIIERIKAAEAMQGLNLTLRSHVGPGELHFFDTMKLLEEYNLRDLTIAFTMIMGMERDSEFLWKKEDYLGNVDKFLEFVKKYRHNILLRKKPRVDFFGLYGYFTQDQVPREHYCNAGRGRLSIGPGGQVYPCFTMEDQKQFWIGSLDQGISTFDVTRFLTVTGRDGITCEDGTDADPLFMYLCPYQNWTMSGKLNVVCRELKESYQGFSRVVEKMKQELARKDLVSFS